MKKSMLFLVLPLIPTLLFFSSFTPQSRPGSLRGTVTDKATGETIPYANVVLIKDSVQIAALATNLDGQFSFDKVEPGQYDLLVSYIGYATYRLNSIMVHVDKPKMVRVQMNASSSVLQEVVVMAERDLIETGKTSRVVEAKEIKNLPYRNVGQVTATTAGVHQADQGISVRGARTSSTIVFIDGVKVRGDINIQRDFSNEDYNGIVENNFKLPKSDPLSTFSIDVDGAAYANTRRFLRDGYLPMVDAVRTEEFINYFNYAYEEPTGEDPFSINTEVSECPWNDKHLIMHIGLKGMEKPMEELPQSNIVFLLDVSGSMNSYDKLDLVKKSLRMMVNQLNEDDRLAIVVYAGASGVVLESTPISNKQKILESLDRLSAGGSTAGASGIRLAYEVAKENFIEDGNNRVILCTDGDFNVGISSQSALIELIEDKRESGVFLSVFGFGNGNLKDGMMEQLANHGNGSYNYIDNLSEAQKVFVNEAGGTILTIAKDVKIQVEFNPKHVEAYRLIGYENRLLAKEDFNDDTKDAGEIGAGHTVTALYEIVPKGAKVPEGTSVDDLKYQKPTEEEGSGSELATVKFRYKKPDESKSKRLEHIVTTSSTSFDEASDNMQFSAAVASFGLVLRNSTFKGSADYDKILSWAQLGKGEDRFGYRGEFVQLVNLAKALDDRNLSSVD